MKIIVDAMGGDNAPGAIVKGALAAARDLGVDIALVGRREAVLNAIRNCGGEVQSLKNVEIVPASQVIDTGEKPTAAIRAKKDSSMTVGLNLLAAGKGDAFVSAGNTGALLTGATLLVKRIKGVRRAALAPVIPTGKGRALLLDAGANAECTPEYLLQFAAMGACYAKWLFQNSAPTVGLLNIGAEPGKGDPVHQEAYAALKKAGESGKFNFVGNVEGREAVMGAVDVIVTDGFSGNIFLKTMEGTAMQMTAMMKQVFLQNMRTKLGAVLVKDGLAEMKKKMDYRETGGTALLGISRPVIKAHGSSDAYAIRSAIRQAAEFAASGVISAMAENGEGMRLPTVKDKVLERVNLKLGIDRDT